ncbi:MAG: hypothetical protein M3P06_05160 [Acidobacteriota bacterium]|nr:hypothetical protein [Acidobacteriota bacterium]
MNSDELRGLGSHWRVSFPELRFLGQIALDRERAEELWRSVGKHFLSRERGSFSNVERFEMDAVVAVVVSNLAFHFDPNADDGADDGRADVQHGFITFITSLLGWKVDRQVLWEERIGRPVRQLLETELGYEEPEKDAGAWRFVRPVLRQGGVPLKLVDRFLDWLAPLASRFELTQPEYSRHLNGAREPGTILKWFLRGPQGFEFCAAVVRCLRSSDDVGPGVRSELIKKARLRFGVRREVQRGARGSRPALALDVPTLRLGINIPDVPREEYRIEGVRVYGFLPLPKGPSQEALRVERKGKGTTELVEVPIPYWPSRTAWAVFSETGGRFITGSSRSTTLPAGRFIVVAADSVQHLLSDMCVEQLGELDDVDATDGRTTVTVCEVPVPCVISLAEGRLLPARYQAPAAIVLVGTPAIVNTSIFVGTGPEVRLSSFTPEMAADFQAWFTAKTSDDAVTPPQAAELQQDGSILYKVLAEAATRVSVWLEPRGIAPRSWSAEGMEVEFVVFPQSTTISWPERPFGYNEHPTLHASGPSIGEVSANGQVLSPAADGSFDLPTDPVVIILIRTERQLSVQITRRVARVTLHATGLEGFTSCPVLFFSDFEQEVRLEINVPHYVADTVVDVGLCHDGRFLAPTSINVPHAVRKGGMLTVSSRSLRDAFDTTQANPAIVAVRIGPRLVSTGVLYARSPAALLLGPSVASTSDLGLVENRWGGIIRDFWTMRERPVSIAFPVDVPRKVLDQFMKRQVALAALLDWEALTQPLTGEVPDLEFLRAGLLARSAGDPVDSDVIASLSDLLRQPNLIDRWRAQLHAILSDFKERSNLAGLVRKWSGCWEELTLDHAAVTDSVLYAMSGAPRLTEGARKLFLSLRSPRPIAFLAGPDGALNSLRSAVAESQPGSPVWILANIFLVGAYLRRGDLADATRLLQETRPRMIGAWAALAQDLDAFLSNASVDFSSLEQSVDAIRIWDIQPQGVVLFELNGGN